MKQDIVIFFHQAQLQGKKGKPLLQVKCWPYLCFTIKSGLSLLLYIININYVYYRFLRQIRSTFLVTIFQNEYHFIIVSLF